MIEFTKKNITGWSRIGSRATFGSVLLSLVEENNNIMVLSADTSTSAGLDRFRKKYPENYVEVGIAEQNLMSIAAGMASEGFDVFTSTFSPFQTLRCCEQIKVNLGYMQHKVCFAGLASGVVLGKLGYTHCSIEDLAIIRSIPNITVLSPADCTETAKSILAALDHNQSVYIRLTGGSPSPKVYENDYEFEIGKAITLTEGRDIALIATGSMVNVALNAADKLEEHSISATVINMHTLKPIDREAVIDCCKSHKLIISVEEHSIIGGLGSAIAEVKTTLKGAPPQLMLGINDTYSDAGDYEAILDRAGLTPGSLTETILTRWNQLEE